MGRFSYVTSSWLETASEEHTEIYGIHIDVVNAISSRFPLNLPHREHGWYLSNDD